ncbi:MAG: agmatinase family protein [Myxococcales bacterium]|nr:agmatinase family protein [Myxococcales bacterium]
MEDPDGPIAADEDGFLGLAFAEDEASVVLVPVPWEPTTSYGRGTVGGPSAIRRASVQVELFDVALAARGLGNPWAWGVHMRREAPAIRGLNARATALARPIGEDARRDTAAVNDCSRQLNAWLYEQVNSLLDAGKLVGVVGGDHSAPLGAIRALAERCPGLGILHVDAHADLRVSYEGFTYSHASIMDNVLREAPGVSRIVQVGIRDLCEAELRVIGAEPRVETHFDHVLRDRLADGVPWRALCRAIVDALPQRVYVSFDIDGLDPALCPNTGTPVPGGLRWAQAMTLLDTLLERGREVVGFDLSEVAGASEWDGNVGARLCYRLCGVALASLGARDR